MNKPESHETLHRGLTNRHLQLIAIGGTVGAGLFLGAGRSISIAGPSIVLVYALIGFFLFFVVRAMGELLLSNFAYKSFADIATDLIGPWAGFYVGWTFWLSWVVIAVGDTIAITGYLELWIPDVPKWIPALAVIVLLIILNAVTVKVFGELESWFAMIKIITIVAFIVIGLFLVLTRFQPDMTGAPEASFANLWNRAGGMFPFGLSGFIGGFNIAIYSFQGVEMAGVASAETADPERNLPKAINSIPLRILVFYVMSLVVIMSVQPWDLIDPSISPFVEMFGFIGIGIAAHVVNFVVLTAAASAANSGVFSTSRVMYGLANEHNGPTVMAKLSRRHIPLNALMLTAACILPAIVLVMLSDTVMDIFATIASLSAVLYITVWAFIMISYLRYLKKYPERHAESTFTLPGGRFTAWAVLGFFAIIVIAQFTDPATRIYLISAPVWFAIMAVVYRLLAKRRAEADPIDWNAERVRARAEVDRHSATLKKN